MENKLGIISVRQSISESSYYLGLLLLICIFKAEKLEHTHIYYNGYCLCLKIDLIFLFVIFFLILIISSEKKVFHPA